MTTHYIVRLTKICNHITACFAVCMPCLLKQNSLTFLQNPLPCNSVHPYFERQVIKKQKLRTLRKILLCRMNGMYFGGRKPEFLIEYAMNPRGKTIKGRIY